MKLHSFGFAVRCAHCGRKVKALWAESVEEARKGNGMCQACLEKHKDVELMRGKLLGEGNDD